MFKDITKISSIALSTFGFLLIVYGWTDRTMLSLGQTLMIMGAFFFVGGLIIFQLHRIALRTAYAVNILRDIDATLSVPPQLTEATSFVPPKTTAINLDNDIEFKQALEKDAVNLLPPLVPVVVVATAAAALALPEMKIEEKPPIVDNPESKRQYYNELVSYLEPKMAELQPIAAEPVKVIEELNLVEDVKISPTSDYNQKLTELASGFPELDALLKRDLKQSAQAPIVEVEEPAPIEPQAIEPEELEPAPLPAVIREGQISGIPFKLYSDGTIEAQFSNGAHRFASIAEFKNYVEGA